LAVTRRSSRVGRFGLPHGVGLGDGDWGPDHQSHLGPGLLCHRAFYSSPESFCAAVEYLAEDSL